MVGVLRQNGRTDLVVKMDFIMFLKLTLKRELFIQCIVIRLI